MRKSKDMKSIFKVLQNKVLEGGKHPSTVTVSRISIHSHLPDLTCILPPLSPFRYSSSLWQFQFCSYVNYIEFIAFKSPALTKISFIAFFGPIQSVQSFRHFKLFTSVSVRRIDPAVYIVSGFTAALHNLNFPFFTVLHKSCQKPALHILETLTFYMRCVIWK